MLNATRSVRQIEAAEVQWVLTTPAIWTDSAKRFMRMAATLAGLCTVDRPEQLLLALEPEAAALACQAEMRLKQESMLPGQKYLLLDAGGGTIDIAAHQLSQDGKTWCEFLPPSGGPWGSTCLNRFFFDTFAEAFGAELMEQFRTECPSSFVELNDKFELAKVQMEAFNMEYWPKIDLPQDLRDLLSTHGKNLKNCLTELSQRKSTTESQFLSLARYRVQLGPQFVREMFNQLLPHIGDHLKALLLQPEAADCSRVFLVGGFGESQILKSYLTDLLASSPELRNPARAAGLDVKESATKVHCVMNGAITFAMEPQRAVFGRVARSTYGIRTFRRFRDGVDPDDKRFVDAYGHSFCKDVFEVLVKKGTLLHENDAARCVVIPIPMTLSLSPRTPALLFVQRVNSSE